MVWCMGRENLLSWGCAQGTLLFYLLRVWIISSFDQDTTAVMEFIHCHKASGGNLTFSLKEKGLSDQSPGNTLIEQQKGIRGRLGRSLAPHSSTLAWKIPWTEVPGRLQSMGPLRVGHGWATSLSVFTFMPWRRKWQPTPVFLPGESQTRRSLVGCRLWGRTELDTTEAT